MSEPLTKRIAELLLAGERGTVKHFAGLLNHPSNNLSSIMRGMNRRGAVAIEAVGRGARGHIYTAGDRGQLEGRVNGSVRRGTRATGKQPASGIRYLNGEAPAAATTISDVQFFVSTDWTLQLIDPARPDDPLYLSMQAWRRDLLPFLQLLDHAMESK
jgi:hypothetical protein